MSLTGFILNSDVKKIFADEFKKPKGKVVGEMKAPPVTKNYGNVGTAFDYLMRFYIKYNNPKASDRKWVAEEVSDHLLAGCRVVEDDNVSKRIVKSFTFAKDTYSDFIKDGVFSEDVLKSSMLLAQIDLVCRIGRPSKDIGRVDSGDIQDLRNLINLVDIEDFVSSSYCLLNPVFGVSELVGGADADIVIDNQMVDIKTTKVPYIDTNMFNQVVGYYILGEIGGMGEERIGMGDIDQIGFYFSRYGVKYMYDIDDIIDFDSLPVFIDKFIDNAKDIYGYRGEPIRKVYLAHDIDEWDEYVDAAKGEICGKNCLEMSAIIDSSDVSESEEHDMIKNCDLFWYLPDWDSDDVAPSVRRQVNYAMLLNKDIEDGRIATNKWW